MTTPIDQPSRDRFASELDRNFSIIAGAGSGKTRAITDRIVQIARSARAREWLPNLVVVTFTNRAADEMQQRARQNILEAGVSLEVLAAFNRAFFGTIHSFCVQLLANHGHYLGLPSQLDPITEDEELWNQFVQRQNVIGASLDPEDRRVLLRHVQVRQLMELARGGRGKLPALGRAVAAPGMNFSDVYSYVAKGSARRTIPRLQEELRTWEQSWRDGEDYLRWPSCTTQTSEFRELWDKAFAPLRRWVNDCSLCVAAEVQRAYREFRLERGFLTFEDQIALAAELMRHPEAARRIREKNYRIVLDEAQDTDPMQFSLLLEIARPPCADLPWLELQADHPRPGHFCMVGDFQQSIYRHRADLAQYRRLHDLLVETGAAEAITFSVTFRLDHAAIDFVNGAFRSILSDHAGQAGFVDLNPRREALPGQVIRLELGEARAASDSPGEIPEARLAQIEAKQLAQWMRETGLPKLRASSWREVAILCPRKAWLRLLRRALRDAGFAVQIQSESELKGESPAYAWFTALATIMAEPLLSYEIVGVLREVFGISDHALALFSQGDGERFQIARPTRGTGVVPQTLNLLAGTRVAIQGLPLFSAAQEIARRVQLRARLRALPAEDFERLDEELDALFLPVAAAEAEGKTLSEFARLLAANFGAAREVMPTTAEAIQLITCHKAKGSEWQAVIVPFLARRVITRGDAYPKIIKNPVSDELLVAFAPQDITPELKQALKRWEQQEMERLLYVALTRAKHTLVLGFDRELFVNAQGEISADAQLRWLRGDRNHANFDFFARLARKVTACGATDARQASETAAGEIEHSVASLPALRPGDRETAAAQASRFVQKLNPSALGDALRNGSKARIYPERDAAPRPATFDNAATRYGAWWHRLTELLPWSADAVSCKRIWEEHSSFSPDPERSAAEWRLLHEHLAGAFDFRRRLPGRDPVAHPEMPFTWRIHDTACLEGIIDLAFFDRAAGKCLILDWKTNRIARGETERLREQYRSQLAAYAKAVAAITQLEVEAGLYSTCLGVFLLYKSEEIEEEWKRLRKLPPPELAAEIAAP